MKVFLTIVLFVVLSNAGTDALQCYVCQGKDNCESGLTTCPSGFDRCGKVTINSGVTKNCTSEVGCTTAKAGCKLAEALGQDCDADCCSGDKCNHSSSVAQSFYAILILGVCLAIFF